MAETSVAVPVTCPECEKRFKPKGDVQGKRIKCPFCKEPFIVPTAKQMKAKADPKKKAKGNPEDEAARALEMTPEEKAAAEARAAQEARDAFDAEFDDKAAYDVHQVKLVPRCPNCTNEMGQHDIICLACGYNTLTREWGKTDKVIRLTFSRHIAYLAPALGAAGFLLASVIGLLYFTVLLPYDVAGSGIFWICDTEAVRMWGSVIFLFWLYGSGWYCIRYFIEKPKPEDIAIEDSE